MSDEEPTERERVRPEILVPAEFVGSGVRRRRRTTVTRATTTASRSPSRPSSSASRRWCDRCSTRCAAPRSTTPVGAACARSTRSRSPSSQSVLSPDLQAELSEVVLPLDERHPHRVGAAPRPGPARRLARRPLPRHPGDPVHPAGRSPSPSSRRCAAAAALEMAQPGRPEPAQRLPVDAAPPADRTSHDEHRPPVQERLDARRLARPPGRAAARLARRRRARRRPRRAPRASRRWCSPVRPAASPSSSPRWPRARRSCSWPATAPSRSRRSRPTASATS